MNVTEEQLMSPTAISDLKSLLEEGDVTAAVESGGDGWNKINIAFSAVIANGIPNGIATFLFPVLAALKSVLCIAYTVGYHRGKREAAMPQFVVAPEQEAQS